MSKIAVIYKSTYGATKKYAEWISEELGADLIERDSAKANMLIDYDIIMYSGGIYASSISGSDLVSKNACKHLIVFTVGLTNPETMDYTDIMHRAFPNQNIQPQKVFHLRGAIDYGKLGFLHRNLMKMLNKAVEKKAESEMNEVEKVIKDTYGKQVDYINRESIRPIIAYIQGIA
ncbi:flavodoxin domain-containing protein [Paenibacillus sp. GM2]|uniref:flavodoxin domain-containing protein n=1 Tax=Paenibacillus sp. GM2 TaxID=1622070 RepID=UPI0008386DBD|nr:flavodoxin domain-containing protein [Paenibacillus sp. GM2]